MDHNGSFMNAIMKNQSALVDDFDSLSDNTDLVTNEQYVIVLGSSIVIWISLSGLGIVSNIINIIIFVKMGLNDGVTLSFLALSIFDLAYLLGTVFQGISVSLYIMEIKSIAFYKVEPYALSVMMFNVVILINITNLLTTTFLAVARCMCVARPLQFKNTFTRRRTVVLLILFIIIAIVTYMPLLANMGLRVRFDPRTNTSRPLLWLSPKRESVKDIIWMLVEIVLPFGCQFITIVCVVVMANSLREASRFRQMSTTVKSEKASGQEDGEADSAPVSDKLKLTGKDLRVVQLVVLISAVFIACNVPRILNSIVCMLVPDYAIGRRYSNLYLSVQAERKHFEILNSAVNFVIYYKYNTKFKQLCKF